MLSSGLVDEAYQRYAIEANQATTYLASFRAITKKYPNQQPEHVLRDLIASTPGLEGKWFAAAKDAGLYDAAIQLSNTSPTDPHTLARAARDFAETRPQFALACGLSALRWIALGYGYEITSADVLDVYAALVLAAANAGIKKSLIHAQINQLLATKSPNKDFLRKILGQRLC